MPQISKLLLGAAFTVALAICALSAQQSADPNSSMNMGKHGKKTSAGMASADSHFMKEAAQGGMAEVELGQLATQKASSNDVKQFGQRMVDDHGKANDQLKQLAAEKNVTLPQDLSAKDKAAKAKLEKLSGEQFDQAYMRDMVKDHTKDVGDFRRESSTAHDPDVKKFAAETLPTLEQHLKQAKSIAPKSMSASSSH